MPKEIWESLDKILEKEKEKYGDIMRYHLITHKFIAPIGNPKHMEGHYKIIKNRKRWDLKKKTFLKPGDEGFAENEEKTERELRGFSLYCDSIQKKIYDSGPSSEKSISQFKKLNNYWKSYLELYKLNDIRNFNEEGAKFFNMTLEEYKAEIL